MKFIVSLLLIALLTSCSLIRHYEFQADEAPDALNFFKQEWIKPYIKNNFHSNKPEQCLLELRKNIPKRWWRYAAEGIYYNLPETIFGNAEERWLNLADRILPDDNVHAFILMIRGSVLTNKGNYKEAISCFSKSYSLSERLKQLYRANDAKRYMARCYLYQGEYPISAKILYEVFDFLKDKSNFFHQVRKFEVMLQLSQIHLLCGSPSKALRWSRQCLYYAQYTGHHPGQIVQANERKAEAFLSLNKPDSALLILKTNLLLRKKYGITYEASNRDYLLGKTLFALKRVKEATPYFKQADYSIKETNNQLRAAEIKTGIADCMYAMGAPDSSILYYQQALKLSSMQSIQAYIHLKLAKIYAQKKQFQLAFFHNQAGNHIFSNFFSQEKSLSLGEIESYYTFINPKSYIYGQLKLQKVLYNQLFFLLLIVFLTIVIAYIYYNKNKINVFKLSFSRQLRLSLDSQSQLLLEKQDELVSLHHLLLIRPNLESQIEDEVNNTALQFAPLPLRMLTDVDWLNFRVHFEKKFPNYISRLQEQYNGITISEIRLLLLIKIGLESKVIAEISGISLESVYRNRTRLRNRLGLDKAEKLETFVANF